MKEEDIIKLWQGTKTVCGYGGRSTCDPIGVAY